MNWNENQIPQFDHDIRSEFGGEIIHKKLNQIILLQVHGIHITRKEIVRKLTVP